MPDVGLAQTAPRVIRETSVQTGLIVQPDGDGKVTIRGLASNTEKERSTRKKGFSAIQIIHRGKDTGNG